jgi:coenzyme F420 hydrogenase subunit beta
LLEFGLATGEISGALVVGMRKAVPFEPKPFIARSIEEIRQASQSKYCPAPTCISFKDVQRLDGRFALVGLPCHIHALHKARAKLPKLRKRIVFTIGLFCGPGPSFLMTEHLLERRGVALKEVHRLRYRDKATHNGDWPGGIAAETSGGRIVRIPVAKYLYAQNLFTRRRCLVCPDYAAEFADVSLGDAHLEEFWSPPGLYRQENGRVLHGKDGWNTLLVRTATGTEWIRRAHEKGYLETTPIAVQKIKSGHWRALYNKRTEFWARLKLRRLSGREPPRFAGLPKPASPLKGIHYLKPVLSTITAELVLLDSIRRLLIKLPEGFLLRKIKFRQKLIKEALESRAE